jgi:hypothetical protein
MALILAIEPDHRQATQLADLIRGRLHADLVHARTTEGALTVLAGIGDRVPDLVLVPSLLSAQEDAAIAGALRVIAAAANVRMLTIPMLADPEQPAPHRGVFARLRGRRTKATPNGCDPAVFAEQIAAYLAEGAAERRARQADDDLVAEDLAAADPTVMPPVGERLAILEPTVAPILDSVGDPAPDSVLEPISDPILESVREPLVEFSVEPIFTSIVAPVVIAPPPQPATVTGDFVAVALDEPVASDGSSVVLIDECAAVTPVEKPRPLWLDSLRQPGPEPALGSAAAAPAIEADADTAVGQAGIIPAIAETPVVATAPTDRFDIGALLAPLLSEIAAKRQAPARIAKPTVVPVVETIVPAVDNAPPAPATVNPAPRELSVPIMTETVPPPAAVQPPAAVSAVTEPDLDPMFFADAEHHGAVDRLPGDRPAWLELIDSLRKDIERLKVERTQPQATAAPSLSETAPRSGRTALSVVTPSATTSEPEAAFSKIGKLTPRAKAPKPIRDQWGLFDPEQCGFAALRAKLDEIGARDEVSV